jgi:hypothetical protein
MKICHQKTHWDPSLVSFNPIYIFFNFLHKILFFDNLFFIFLEIFNISSSNLISVEVVKVLTRVILWYLGSFDNNDIICGKMLKF